MTQDSKRERAGVEGDMISNLPIEVTLHILGFLPIKDAAKTSALSRRWRYIWTTNPNLVLDRHSLQHMLTKSPFLLLTTVDRILLIRDGDIHKFVLCCPIIDKSIHNSIDTWIQHITKKGVKELTINNMPNRDLYLLTSHVYNCSTLTHLNLSRCLLCPKISFTNFFSKLETLYVERSYFEGCVNVIKTPRLIKFTMINCNAHQYDLKLDSPLLEYLDVQFWWIKYPNMLCFTNCKKVRFLKLEHLEYPNPYYTSNNEDRSTLVKLVSNLASTLEKLTLGPIFIQMLSGNTVPFSLNRLLHLILRIDFDDSASTSMALQLIKSSPCLKSLHIFVVKSFYSISSEALVNYLNESVFLIEELNKLKESVCLDQQFNNLKDVVISGFSGSKAEALFVKLLLRESPSLTRMQIEYEKYWQIEFEKYWKKRDTISIEKVLESSTKASSKAKILCLTCTQ